MNYSNGKNHFVTQPSFGLGMNCLENKAGILGLACESNSRSEPVIPMNKDAIVSANGSNCAANFGCSFLAIQNAALIFCNFFIKKKVR